MSPTRLAVFAMVLLTATTVRAQSTIDFGPTELGEIKTSCFTACFGNDCSASGTVSSIDVDAPFFVRGLRTADVSDDTCNEEGPSTPANLPVTLGPGQRLAVDVDLVPTTLGVFDHELSINDEPAIDFFADIHTVAGCFPSPTANCLQDDRFKVRTLWRTDFGTRGAGPVVPAPSDDSGLFYFFDQDNWEILLKVLNGCPINNRFWVFSAATTNVEFTVTVTDTQEQEAVSYFKPQGPPAPAITDTSAFATCP